MAKPLEWEHVGPAREPTIEVPGISIGNYAYVLVYDRTRDRVVYERAVEYGGKNELWTWDGTRWELATQKGLELDDELHAFHDASRGGVACWMFPYDHEHERHVPRGVLADAAGARAIATTGEPPLVEPDSDEPFFTSSNMCGAVAYDEGRDVTVCVTRRGVYELDAKGAWTRAGEPTGLPAEWHNDTGGAYDPVGERCVFWIQGRGDGYKYQLFAWRGGELAKLPTKGLPNLMMGLFEPCAQFCGHPTHGFVCNVGPRGMFALAGETWTRLPEAKNAPPLMGGRAGTARAKMTFHAGLGAFVLGPGNYEGHPGGSDAQQVFWILRGDTWERQGAIVTPSPIEKLYGRHHAAANGTWYATNKRGLHTLCWTEAGWKELVDDKRGEAVLGKDYNGRLVGTPDGLVAISRKGAVFRLDQGGWKPLAKASKVFKERSDFLAVWDGTRIVAWGGEVKNRKANDTLVFDGKTWTAMKKASPVPKDFKPKGIDFVDFTIVHDAALGRLVRFGYSEVATLEGEVWTPARPKGYAVGGRAWEHVPAHDPVTGETLLVDFTSGKILRFDLGGCAEVATFVYPKALIAAAERERESVQRYFCEDYVFDPVTRSIHSQHASDAFARSRLDLAPAFEAAAKLGPRKLLGAPAQPKAGPITLYRYAKGKVDIWRGDAKQLEIKRKAGFVPARDLAAAALEALGTRRSSALVVTGKKPATHATSRLGGLPSGITAKAWPKKGGAPMGFLFQLVTDAVPGHAGIAVFCALDGTATEDDGRNRVVLLARSDLARAPLAAPPAGVPVLPERAITIADARPEIDEDVVGDLVAKDPDLGAAFDAYQAKTKVQDASLGSKLGGAPFWLQGGELGKAMQFVAQLDVDTLSLKGWDEAGLAGCVYVLAKGKSAFAVWQYT